MRLFLGIFIAMCAGAIWGVCMSYVFDPPFSYIASIIGAAVIGWNVGDFIDWLTDF